MNGLLVEAVSNLFTGFFLHRVCKIATIECATVVRSIDLR